MPEFLTSSPPVGEDGTPTIRPLETLEVEGLVRLWAHEALRLIQDRLVEEEERVWTNTNIDSVALKHFPNIDKEKSLARPILFSNWLSKNYIPVERGELRDYTKARLKVFYEEELGVPLVLTRCSTTYSGSTGSSGSPRVTSCS